MVAGIMESRDLETSEAIPVELRARVEAVALFDALHAGDYAGAALAQERLRTLGWNVSREPAPAKHLPRRKPHTPRPARAPHEPGRPFRADRRLGRSAGPPPR